MLAKEALSLVVNTYHISDERRIHIAPEIFFVPLDNTFNANRPVLA